MKLQLDNMRADLSGYSEEDLEQWRVTFEARMIEAQHQLDVYNEGCNSGAYFPREKGFRPKTKRLIAEYRLGIDRIRAELKRRTKMQVVNDFPLRFVEAAEKYLPAKVFETIKRQAQQP